MMLLAAVVFAAFIGPAPWVALVAALVMVWMVLRLRP